MIDAIRPGWRGIAPRDRVGWYECASGVPCPLLIHAEDAQHQRALNRNLPTL